MKQISFLLLLLTVEVLFAQTYLDEALLFTRTNISGTSRSIGSAGAYGSVGADLGTVAINPAGLGLYRSTDFCFTPALLVSGNQAQFQGTNTNTTISKVLFNQAGVSFTKLFAKPKKGNDFTFNSFKLNSITFAINYQRQSMFDRTQNFSGFSQYSSAISYAADVVNYVGQPFNTDNYPVEWVLAAETGLIGYDTVTGSYFSNVPSPVSQSGKIVTKGAVDQVDLALGGNVNDKFYFGAGIGIGILTHSYSADFSEYDSKDTGSVFSDYSANIALRNTGLGVNAKFGIIYRPASWLRLGVAYHIPTFYSVTENYSATLYANFATANYASGRTGSPFRYKLRTPMKGVVSASFYFKENGFFSVDYEFLNYGSSRYDFGKDFQSISDQINGDKKKYYTFGHIIRAGLEGSYKSLRVRGGYSFSGTPYKKDYVNKQFPEVRHSATGGLGYRGQRFYADIAYMFTTVKYEVYPYADFEVFNTSKLHTVFVTVGWKMGKKEPKESKKKEKGMSF